MKRPVPSDHAVVGLLWSLRRLGDRWNRVSDGNYCVCEVGSELAPGEPSGVHTQYAIYPPILGLTV